MPGSVVYECAAWEQSVANAAMHSAVSGRPLATLQIAQCSRGEWKAKNEKVLKLLPILSHEPLFKYYCVLFSRFKMLMIGS